MKSKYHFSFEDLKVYQKAMDFAEYAYLLAKKFPKDEQFALKSQYKRAADSIALNISEGACGSDAQFHNYLGNAWYSANECVSCVTKTKRRDYISFEEFEENRKLLSEITKMITTLRKKIYQRINNITKP